MVHQYRTHVLCHHAGNSGGFYHAVDTVLAQLDILQNHFLHHLNISKEEAFLDHNLAPLGTRRDIAMLGLIFKCAHGLAHDDFQHLFPRSAQVAHQYETKLQQHRHKLQLQEERPGTHHAMLRRSVFGLTRVWNRLPKGVVAEHSVTNFQKALTSIVRTACVEDTRNWELTLSPRKELLPETLYF